MAVVVSEYSVILSYLLIMWLYFLMIMYMYVCVFQLFIFVVSVKFPMSDSVE